MLAVTAAGAALALMFGGGDGGHRRASPGRAAARPPVHLTFVGGLPYVNGRPFPLAVAPSLQPGNVGLCVMSIGGGSCDGPYPSPGDPLYDTGVEVELRVGPAGEVDYLLASAEVAAVRVHGLGTFRPVTVPGLPPGERVVVFYRRPGSPGSVVVSRSDAYALETSGYGGHHPSAVMATPLNAAGRAIPTTGSDDRTFLLASRYWAPPAPAPAGGRGALGTRLPGATVQWGEVATAIAPDPAATAAAFLTCAQVWFRVPGGAFQAAVLLDALSPGRRPGPLWGAIAVPGHPGVVQIDAHEYTPPGLRAPRSATAWSIMVRRLDRGDGAAAAARLEQAVRPPIVLEPLTVARRVGPTWVMVLNGGGLAREVQLLDELALTSLRLH
jgi:hypothetical protein